MGAPCCGVDAGGSGVSCVRWTGEAPGHCLALAGLHPPASSPALRELLLTPAGSAVKCAL